jgi:hypothetical protein
MYTFSVAVFVQALVVVTFSAVADHGRFPLRYQPDKEPDFVR